MRHSTENSYFIRILGQGARYYPKEDKLIFLERAYNSNEIRHLIRDLERLLFLNNKEDILEM